LRFWDAGNKKEKATKQKILQKMSSLMLQWMDDGLIYLVD
jgi:hypothetical protein